MYTRIMMTNVDESEPNPGVHPEVDKRVDTGVGQGKEQEHCVDVAHDVAETRNTLCTRHLLTCLTAGPYITL